MLAMVLTLARLPLAAGFAVAVAAAASGDGATIGPAWAWGLIAIAALEELTDFFDGFAARRTGTVTRLGGILDPLADSLARLTMYFAMGLAGWVTLAVPLAMTLRDVLVSYTRIVQAMTGGKTSARISGKLKAVIQGGGVFVLVVVAAGWLGASAEALGWARHITAGAIIAVTAWSLADYIRGAMPGIQELRAPVSPAREPRT